MVGLKESLWHLQPVLQLSLIFSHNTNIAQNDTNNTKLQKLHRCESKCRKSKRFMLQWSAQRACQTQKLKWQSNSFSCTYSWDDVFHTITESEDNIRGAVIYFCVKRDAYQETDVISTRSDVKCKPHQLNRVECCSCSAFIQFLYRAHFRQLKDLHIFNSFRTFK